MVDAAFPPALWSFYAATGIRPEWIVPVLYSESGLDPSATNSIGCVGINQLCPFAWPIPDGYASWSASQQLLGPVSQMMAGNVRRFGALRSGTRVYQSNFLPATLATARDWGSVLAMRGGAIYAANAGLDVARKGTILVSDLGHFVARAAASSTVRSILAMAYAQNPGAGPMTDPVLGEDFGAGASSQSLLLAAVAVLFVAGATAFAVHHA